MFFVLYITLAELALDRGTRRRQEHLLLHRGSIIREPRATLEEEGEEATYVIRIHSVMVFRRKRMKQGSNESTHSGRVALQSSFQLDVPAYS